ncbi:MAG TPA: ATP-binding protein [Gemmatimonadaceae bacterium]|nr:ATP-binding protein [Gemmatimonadaceae bacterium]
MQAELPDLEVFNTPALLEAFFERSRDGFFFMMIDQPVEWGPDVDKEAALDYVFSHQRMTKVNPAMVKQFRAPADQLIGRTPKDFFRHNLAAGRRGWRKMFDDGHSHSITEERRLDGSPMWVEGDYMCFYDSEGRITGHFGIQRDVTDRTLAAAELERSRSELRALAARIQTTREEERTRIAREIHDELGQTLTALKLDLAWVETRLPNTDSGVYRLGEASLTERVDKMMQIVRRIATELRPSVLDQLGLEAAIEWLVQESTKRTGIPVTLRAEEFPSLPDEISSNAFRIIQEALTNVARHSKASCVDVRVRHHGPNLLIEVEDDGVGISEPVAGTQSLGLVGMRERAVSCGGTLKIRCEPGRGTTVIVELPVART